MRKFALPLSCMASAAAAFGLGVMVVSSPQAPPLTLPVDTSTTQPAEPADDAEPVAHTSPGVKPPTTPQRPSAAPRAGQSGPFKDAQGDGKVLDDMGKALVPNAPVSVPDVLLPFPGHGEGEEAELSTPVADEEPEEYPYEPEWGDAPEDAADPGVVCDPILAADLGVPLGDCTELPNKLDVWHPPAN